MIVRRRTRACAHTLAAVVLAFGASAASAQSETGAPLRRAGRLPAPLEQPRAGWPTNGGNLFNQRYSPLVAIDRANVAQLKGVWRTHLEGSGLAPQYSGEAQPLVHDGLVFVSTGADDVFALRVTTGEILWRYEAKLDPAITTVCCGWANRGVALGEGKVFLGQLDGKLVALDEQTGKVVWSIQAERWQDGFTVTSAPLYYDGMVISGFAGAELATRGRVKAYSASRGKLLWTFYTIPGPGEPGHESWPRDGDVWKHGGASVWQTPAVDPELGLLYFSTGNPGPDFNGAVRAGDNLYSSSIVAIDAHTGRYRWHFQQVHHDLWDYDATNPVVLFDVRIDGAPRKGIAEVNKTGFTYILDRETGKPLVGIEERPVPQEPRQATAATQPYPLGDSIVPQHVEVAPEGLELANGGRIFTPFLGDRGVAVNPGLYGGANWPPSSYDPERQRLFVCASSAVGNYVGGDREFAVPAGGTNWLGGVVGFAALPRTGIFAAVDVTTNKLVWRYQWPDQCYSGSVATAGGLVFVGRNDGRLTALDSDTGKQLWEFQTGAGMNSTASVFEHDGREYVVAYSAGNALIGSPHGDSVWLFGLNGTLPSASPRDTEHEIADAAAAAAAARSGARANYDPKNLAQDGVAIFQTTCVVCHGTDGKGGHGGGAPLDRLTDRDAVAQTITAGRNNMPPFGAALTPEQIRAVAAYIVEDLFDKDAKP